MSTEVIITGTGTPIPSQHRAGPGVAIRCGDIALQLDAGRGTVQRLTAAGVALADLTAFFATHHHSDHLTGLQDLVLSRWVMERQMALPPLPVVVPDGPAANFARRMLDAWDDDIAIRMQHAGRTQRPDYEVIAFPTPEKPAEVWAVGDVKVLAGRVRHEPVRPAAGFRVETPDGVAALAEGADVLVHEAMRFELIERLPQQRHFILDYHADTRLIGRQAQDLSIDTLVLTHLIPEPTTAEQRQGFVDDIRDSGFEGTLLVANDLDVVTLGDEMARG